MNNQTVFITGSSRGIGRAIALRFAAARYRVVINGFKHADELNQVKAEIESFGSECLALIGDVGNPPDVSSMFQKIKETFGDVDVLVNNAGISYVGLLTDMTLKDWERIINVNLSSLFYCCKEVIPSMVRQKKGKILNISSVWGITGASCEAAYSAAKGGVNSFTKSIAKELAPSNIQVNAIAFGAVETDMNHCFTPEEIKSLSNDIPAGRLSTPTEAADFVFEIICNTSNYLTGQIISFDGGWI